jgi:acyl-coenzyme A thioesterase PaaI-like protein
MTLILPPDELNTLLQREFPQVADAVAVISADGTTTVVSMMVSDHHLRPGGTVSGPTIFLLADVTFYLGLLSVIGPVLLAVTTNTNINFMRKSDPTGLMAVCRILKRGKRLAMGDVLIYSAVSQGDDISHLTDPVAHATMTYSIPPL